MPWMGEEEAKKAGAFGAGLLSALTPPGDHCSTLKMVTFWDAVGGLPCWARLMITALRPLMTQMTSGLPPDGVITPRPVVLSIVYVPEIDPVLVPVIALMSEVPLILGLLSANEPDSTGVKPDPGSSEPKMKVPVMEAKPPVGAVCGWKKPTWTSLPAMVDHVPAPSSRNPVVGATAAKELGVSPAGDVTVRTPKPLVWTVTVPLMA